MQAERWERIQRVFDEATQRSPAERDRYVESECGDDEELKSEVCAMIAADTSAGDFIETAVRSATTAFAASKDPTRELTKFGKYEILGWIGEGGFSQVHKGRDPMLQRVVAIKTCTSASPDIRRRFYREGTIAAGLQHPNIVTVHDLGVENGVPFLVQEFLSGEDLATKLAKQSSISPSTAVDYLIQVARGLEYAHEKGVLHRDIKPSNVQALNSGRVKILDFGIARFLEDENPLTDQGTPIGTAGYQSPEQLEGLELDRRTDVFSFGVLAYELIASTRPFPGRSFAEVYHRVLNERPIPLRRRVRGCPPALEALVERCLENKRARRPKDFSQVVAALEEVAAMLPPPTKPGAVLPTHEMLIRRRARQLPRTATIAVAALLATAILFWSLNRRASAPVPRAATSALPASEVGGPRSKDLATLPAGESASPAASGPSDADTETTDGAPDADEAPARATAPVASPRGDVPSPALPPTPAPELASSTAEPPQTAATRSADQQLDVASVEGADELDGATPSSPPPATAAVEPQVDRSAWEETAPPVGAEDLPEVAAGATPPAPPQDDEAIGVDATPAPIAPIPNEGPELQPPPPKASESFSPQRTLAEQPPELLEKLTLVYPTRISAKQRVQLQREESIHITMQVLVDEDGRVRQASVRSTNEPGGTAFQEAAKAVVVDARFRPGMRDGKPEPMWTLLSLEYPLP